ncbi:MAG TPA: Fic family protein [Pseudogracilibacillus sp.]|nr:Fic family protein [Pseudogracilibacillus sp.]
MDPYVYEDTNVLINKLDIRDEEILIDVEAQLFIANVLDISNIIKNINIQTYKSFQAVHKYLFHELYSWAGEFRTVNIYKSEQALTGLSISYSDEKHIESDLEKIFNWSKTIHWSYDNKKLVEDFAKFMIEIWRIHPFREGNTRTTSVFMHLFAEINELEFNGQLLSHNPGYLRKALVLAAVEEAPEPEYLLIMLRDALNLMKSNGSNQKEEQSEKYKVIKKYDVSKYNQKPFETDKE